MTTIVDRIGSLTVGRVENVTAEELNVVLFNETPQATALNTGSPTGFPRVNAYVLIPNETGAVVAVIKGISIIRAKGDAGSKDDALVDLPFLRAPSRPFHLARSYSKEMTLSVSRSTVWSAAYRCYPLLAIQSYFRHRSNSVQL